MSSLNIIQIKKKQKKDFFKKHPFFVKKFGGTSIGSIERLEKIANLILKDYKLGRVPVVILSAMSGETNRLVEVASKIHSEYKGDAYDMLLASGEQVSIALLSMALEKRGASAVPLLAYQLGIKTDSLYARARIKKINTNKIKKYLDEKKIPVIAGFQGIDQEERITTLGRGGSDITAVAIAAALGSDVCEIFTDVTAVYSADPRLVKKAKRLSFVSYAEMMEMSSLGSKVLHSRSVELAKKFNVKIHVRSSFESVTGTWIIDSEEEEDMEQPLVTSVVHELDIIIIKVHPLPKKKDFLACLFEALSEAGVVVDIITESPDSGRELSLCFSVGREDKSQVRKILSKMIHGTKSIVSYIENGVKISIVGVGMKNYPGVAARFFRILNDNKIPIHLVTTSEIKISAIIDQSKLKIAAQALHSGFELDLL